MCNAIGIAMDSSLYLVELKKLLTFDIREMVKSGADVSEEHFLEKAVEYLRTMCIHGPKHGDISFRHLLAGRAMGQETLASKMWEEIKPEVEKHVADSIKQCRSKRMVTEIRQLTAQAQINKAIEDAGLKCIVIPQTYRAKVAIKLGQKNKVIFYISYKNTEEDLKRCISSAKELIALVDSLGKGASIQKIMPYENW